MTEAACETFDMAVFSKNLNGTLGLTWRVVNKQRELAFEAYGG